MPLVPASFTSGSVSPSFNPQTWQEVFDEAARLLAGSVAVSGGTYLDGGTEPGSDMGPWLPDGAKELWFWDAAFGRYYPGGLPAGTIIISPHIANFDTLVNYMRCDGTSKSQATYPRLFAAIGHQWATDATDATNLQAAGNFRVPNSDGRVLVGAGFAAPNSDPSLSITGRVIGQTGGQERRVLAAANLPAVSLSFDARRYLPSYAESGVPPVVYGGGQFDPASTTEVYTTSLSVTGALSTPVETMPPFWVTNYLIRY